MCSTIEYNMKVAAASVSVSVSVSAVTALEGGLLVTKVIRVVDGTMVMVGTLVEG